MPLTIGLDVGTTTLSLVALDTQVGRLAARLTVEHGAGVSPARGRAELDLPRVLALTTDALGQLAAQLGGRRREVRAIGVTGQQHGLALLDATGAPLGLAITWQDERVLDKWQVEGSKLQAACARQPSPRGEEGEPATSNEQPATYLARFTTLAGGREAFGRMGGLPAAGYLGPSLFWLRENGLLPERGARACLVPDAAVAYLTGALPPTDPTNGGSSGLFDIVARDWAWEIIDRLGLPRGLFPPVREPGEPAGTLRDDLAARTGLPAGLPVGVAMGDNQASFLGSVRDPAQSILVNVGTGSQISARVEGFIPLAGLDTRYYPGGRYLLVGAGLFGGRSYALLRDFYRQVVEVFGERQGSGFRVRGSGSDVTEPSPNDLTPALSQGEEEHGMPTPEPRTLNPDFYARMNALAAQAPPGCEGLRCTPLFAGARDDPSRRASLEGLAAHNFTPGHLTRALLEGIAEGFYTFYQGMAPALGERVKLVGSGNGIRQNPLLGEIIAARFGLPLSVSAAEEEAAVGAALAAAVGVGLVPGWDAASALLASDGPPARDGR